MMKKRQLLTAIGLAGLGLLSQGQALAQADYPNKPIKLIVAFPPGGTSDVMGRLMPRN
jgi:tripartite-type tricarboxylate transporter receptor subunit TctC